MRGCTVYHGRRVHRGCRSVTMHRRLSRDAVSRVCSALVPIDERLGRARIVALSGLDEAALVAQVRLIRVLDGSLHHFSRHYFPVVKTPAWRALIRVSSGNLRSVWRTSSLLMRLGYKASTLFECPYCRELVSGRFMTAYRIETDEIPVVFISCENVCPACGKPMTWMRGVPIEARVLKRVKKMLKKGCPECGGKLQRSSYCWD